MVWENIKSGTHNGPLMADTITYRGHFSKPIIPTILIFQYFMVTVRHL